MRHRLSVLYIINLAARVTGTLIISHALGFKAAICIAVGVMMHEFGHNLERHIGEGK